MKRLKIQPIGNPKQDLGNDPDAYRVVFCDQDMDSVQVTQCKKCDNFLSVFVDVKCDWEKS